MTSIEAWLAGAELIAWRLDQRQHASSWDSGLGAYNTGARWNSKGVRAVYASIDPALGILEVAVHKGFSALDTVPHTLTAFSLVNPRDVHVVAPAALPNPSWLLPGAPSGGQQQYGDELLKQYVFIAIPSTVSKYSWNLIFDPVRAVSAYAMKSQEPLALDTRLNPPKT
jgi:RES domain-containing protein